MHQTPGDEYNETSPRTDPEVERIQERLGLVRKVNGFVWFLFGFIEVIIGLRVGLKLLGADPANTFTAFIYDLSYPFVAPFFGIVEEPQAASGGVLEVGSIIAMLIYLLAAWGLTKLITLIMVPADADRVDTRY